MQVTQCTAATTRALVASPGLRASLVTQSADPSDHDQRYWCAKFHPFTLHTAFCSFQACLLALQWYTHEHVLGVNLHIDGWSFLHLNCETQEPCREPALSLVSCVFIQGQLRCGSRRDYQLAASCTTQWIRQVILMVPQFRKDPGVSMRTTVVKRN